MRGAATAAYAAAALHLVAAAVLVLVLSGGLPPHSDGERQQFMQANRAAWIAGWTIWQLTALSLAYVFARLRRVIPFAIVAVAATIDISCEVVYAYVLPNAASFAAIDRALEILIGGVANGLYTIGLAVLIADRSLPRHLRVLAVPVIAAGVALSAGSFAHLPRVSVVASAILFPLFTLWLIIAGRWLQRSG